MRVSLPQDASTLIGALMKSHHARHCGSGSPSKPTLAVGGWASIKFRGDQPECIERWEYIYRAIKLSKPMDESPSL
jgi:hypothetical protein